METKLEVLPTAVLLEPAVDDVKATRLRRAATALLVLSVLTFHGISGAAGVIAALSVLLISSRELVKKVKLIKVCATITAVGAAVTATTLTYLLVTDAPVRHLAVLEDHCNKMPSATFEWGETSMRTWERHHHHDHHTGPPRSFLVHGSEVRAEAKEGEGRSLQEAKAKETAVKGLERSDLPATSTPLPAIGSVSKEVDQSQGKGDDKSTGEQGAKEGDDSEEAILAAAEIAVDAAEAEGLYDDVHAAEHNDQAEVTQGTEEDSMQGTEDVKQGSEHEGDDDVDEEAALLAAADIAVEAFQEEMMELESLYLYGDAIDGQLMDGEPRDGPSDKQAHYCHAGVGFLARWASAFLMIGAVSQLLLAVAAAAVAKRASQLIC